MRQLVVILFLLVPIIASSQDSLEIQSQKRNSIQINVTNLLYKDVSHNYTRSLSKNYSLEFILGRRFASNNNIDKKTTLIFEDPFWLYNNVSSRIGLRFKLGDIFYFSPMLMFKYSFFDDRRFPKYRDREGDLYDEDWVINRQKYLFGGLVKLGYTYSYKCMIFDFYMGAGLGNSTRNEQVNKRLDWYGKTIPDNYPLISKANSIVPTIHAGVQFGLKL